MSHNGLSLLKSGPSVKKFGKHRFSVYDKMFYAENRATDVAVSVEVTLFCLRMFTAV